MSDAEAQKEAREALSATYINPKLPGMIRNLYRGDLRPKSIQDMLDLAADLVQELIDLRAAEPAVQGDAKLPQNSTPEPTGLVQCPHWAPGRITLRKGCTACAAPTMPIREECGNTPEAALIVPATDLKALREALCEAQITLGIIDAWPDEEARAAEVIPHRERIEQIIAEIDRHRPLGPDGKHGNLHTPTCGCDDR